MQEQLGTWVIRTLTTGITTVAATQVTAIQYVCSATNSAEVVYFAISQSGTNTSLMDRVRLIRKTAAATVTAGVVGTTVFDCTGNAATGAGSFRGTLSTTGTGVSATAEGTDGDEIMRMDFNSLSGYEHDFQPAHRVWVPPSGIIAVKLAAIVALNYNVMLVVRESR